MNDSKLTGPDTYRAIAAPAMVPDGRCPTCRQRNSRVREHLSDDGETTIVWHCNVAGCSNGPDVPRPEPVRMMVCKGADACSAAIAKAHPHGRAPVRTVQGVVGSSDMEGN